MWDLATIQRLNELAHARSLERAFEDEIDTSVEREVQPPMIFPLSVLARKLLGGPPSLTYFIELLESSDAALEFVDLVREYLPDREADIMMEDIDRRVAKFTRYFVERYFPLVEDCYDEGVSMRAFVGAIPVEYMGFSDVDFHNFMDFRTGYILLLSLVISPFDESLEWEEYDMEEPGPGGRVPIITAVGDLIGDGLAKLIPAEGWTPEDLHKLTDGTKFAGCGDFADWVCSNTGYVQMDTTRDYEYTGDSIDWERFNVDQLADEWKMICEIQNRINRLVLLLEKDPVENFKDLIYLLLEREDMIIPSEQIPLPLDEHGQVIT